jgi:hypothetical protein
VSRLRRIAAGGAAFVALLPSVGAIAESGPAALPTAAGVVRIHADGSSGVRLDSPIPFDFQTGEEIRFLPEAGTGFAWVGFRADPAEDLCAPGTFCLSHDVTWVGDDYYIFPGYTLPPGIIEIFVVSDGPLTVEIDFAGLVGTLDLTADHVASDVRRLDGACVEPACEPLRYGGQRHNVDDGLVVAIAFARTAVVPLTDSHHTLNVCVYPNPGMGLSSSSDPAAHPAGCDPPGLGDLDEARYQTESTVLPRSFSIIWAQQATGDTYVGFRRTRIDTLHESKVRAYGLWVGGSIG